MKIFASLYTWMMKCARHRHASYYLYGLTFAESSFFPIPPDVMLAPMSLAKPEKAWIYAAFTTIFSVLGGIFGYLIGMFFFDIIQPYIEQFGYMARYEQAVVWFGIWGFWMIFIAGFSPIPYKVFTIAAGVIGMSLPVFILASLIGRGGRFFLVAGLMRWGGPRMEKLLHSWVDRIGWTVVGLLAVALLLTVTGCAKSDGRMAPVDRLESFYQAHKKQVASKPRSTKTKIATVENAPVFVPDAAPIHSKWRWPVNGQLIAGFSGGNNPNKGIDIAAQRGEAVHATMGGTVVYSGRGLKGYGEMIIVKHNDEFLSAYAHNQKLLVREGDTVKSGQVIALAGDTDAPRTMLHFEIRQGGKPVDPQMYLPRR
jgi:membrane protein YqaA with SNARE-associated domain/biotin carboxyl carrier protein